MSTTIPRTVPSWRWPAEAIWQAVAPLLPGFTVEVLPSIDSTNRELMRRARAGRCEPTLLVAEQQTAGRGRLGRSWHSACLHAAEQDNGAGLAALTFSLGLPLAPANWSGLSLAVGVSVAESLQPALPEAGGRTPRIGLKWPNDLWLEGAGSNPHRKLGGILVETASMVGTPSTAATSTGAALRYVVVGVGLNVQTPVLDSAGQPPLSVPPGSLQELAAGGESAMLDAPAALLRVAAPLVAMLQAFEGYGFEPMQPRFDRRDVLRGRSVVLSDGSTGVAHGVGADGALLVLTTAGMQTVTSSDISVRPTGAAPAGH